MGFFKDLQQSLTDAISGVAEQVERYKKKGVLEAFMATCAYIAAADGHIDPSEKRKMVGFVQNSDLLKVYNTDEAVALFTKYARQFEFDFEVGKLEVLRTVGKFRTDSEVARTIIRVGILIGKADGDFDISEKRAVRDIVLELGQPLEDFDLQDLDKPAASSRENRITLGGNK